MQGEKSSPPFLWRKNWGQRLSEVAEHKIGLKTQQLAITLALRIEMSRRTRKSAEVKVLWQNLLLSRPNNNHMQSL
jgi:hypothetical protein